MKTRLFYYLIPAFLFLYNHSFSQNQKTFQKIEILNDTIMKVLQDWNVPGCGIGVVIKNKLVFANGYGFRNLEKKLPVTPNTLFQIASNTKLFTATSIGFLVEEGKLDWDMPVKKYVPQIRFYNDQLDATVTIRDMLSHRTGISRHDLIWYKSDFTRPELFERLKYLEPSIPLRQGYLYNNLMYSAAGQIIEILTGKTWEDFVRSRIFIPLNMSHSMFVVEEMQKQPDFMTPYYEKRDTNILLPYPFYSRQQGMGPCGSIISSINDLSYWLIVQMNGGRFGNKQVIPEAIIKETMKPAIPNSSVPDKYWENLNSIYGMGRSTSVYKGHYRTQHGGAIGGIYSNISFMPADSVGVIVFTNGAHASSLPGIITNIVYDRILDLSYTPWSQRNLTDYLKNKETERQARQKTGTDQVPGTKPSHALIDYSGIYEDPAYGKIEIIYKNDDLGFLYNNVSLPLKHYHYDRFISPDDEIDGQWSFIFNTDAQGDISELRVSLDEKEVVFTKKADPKLSDPAFLKKLTGKYELDGSTISIEINNNELTITSAPPQHLVPYKGNSFRIREFSDQIVEFLVEPSGIPRGIKLTYNGKTFEYKKLNK